MIEPPDPQPPLSIERAVRLMRVGAVLTALGAVYALSRFSELERIVRENAIENDPEVSEATITTGIAVSVGFTLVFGVIGVVLWLVVARHSARGRAWSRIAAVVLAFLYLATYTAGLGAEQQTPISLTISSLTVAVGLAALSLLYRRESSDYLTAQTYGTA